MQVEYEPTPTMTNPSTTTPEPRSVDTGNHLVKVVLKGHRVGHTRKNKQASDAEDLRQGAAQGTHNVSRKPFNHFVELKAACTKVDRIQAIPERYGTRTGEHSTFILKTPKLLAFTEELNRETRELEHLVDAAKSAHAQRLAEAPVKMGTSYNPDDYFPAEEIEGRVRVELKAEILSNPSVVAPEITGAVADQLASNYEETIMQTEASLWKQLLDGVSLLAGMFEKGKQRMADAAWDRLRDLLQSIPERQIRENPEMKEQMEIIRKLLLSAPKEAIKENEQVREAADAVATQIKDRIKSRLRDMGV